VGIPSTCCSLDGCVGNLGGTGIRGLGRRSPRRVRTGRTTSRNTSASKCGAGPVRRVYHGRFRGAHESAERAFALAVAQHEDGSARPKSVRYCHVLENSGGPHARAGTGTRVESGFGARRGRSCCRAGKTIGRDQGWKFGWQEWRVGQGMAGKASGAGSVRGEGVSAPFIRGPLLCGPLRGRLLRR
jgi:hypothetical protein